MSTDGTIAFITGGNRGIGRETARQLGKLGITVVIGSRDLSKGLVAADALRSEGIAVECLLCDVTQPQDHRAAFDYLARRHAKLDVLVNNAAIKLDGAPQIADLPGGHTSSISPQLLRDTFETNFFGLVALTQTLLPLIRRSSAGRIVNLSSRLGSLTLHAMPASPIDARKAFAYGASKTALNAFTVHLAHELRDTPIKVNSAHPGWVKTDMGGPDAELEVFQGAQTTVRLATLPVDGPTGGFFHFGEALPW